MNNLLIPNPEELELIKQAIKEQGKDKLHILTDFDKTLTYAFMGREKEYPSVISILRNGNYLTKDYAKQAHALFDLYHLIEIDPTIPTEEKKIKMKEWWKKHLKLLIESKLNKKDLENVIKSGIISLRKGTKELLGLLHKNNIPLVILSSNGVGDTIEMYLKQENLFYQNIHIITNSFEYNKQGNAIKAKPPIIHVMNKTEIAVKNYPKIFNVIKGRTNVILLGDGLGDLGMVEGFPYKNLIKIGFLNENPEQNLKSFKENFDIILLNDTNMDEVNKLLKEVIS